MHKYFRRNYLYIQYVLKIERLAVMIRKTRSFGGYFNFFFFFLRNSLGLYYPKSCQPRRASWILQLKTFSNFKNWRDSNELPLAFPCKKRNPAQEHPLKFPPQLQNEKEEEKSWRLYQLSREISREKNAMLRRRRSAHFRTRSFLFLSRLARDYQRAQFPSRGERAPRKFRQRRALTACTRVNTSHVPTQLSRFPFLCRAVRVSDRNARCFSSYDTFDEVATGWRCGEGWQETERKTERRGRDGDGNEESNGLFQPGLRGPCGQESEGTRREEEGKRRYLTVCDSNNEGSLEVHSTDVLSWAKLMRFLFLQFRCFVLDPVLTSSPWTPKVTFLFVTEITEENIECMCG